VSALRGKTVFITGSDKNAGKTTFLNYALARARQSGQAAYLTIGVDGEKRDLIFGHPKPRITAEAGDLLVTTESMLAASPALFCMEDLFSGSTVLGRLVLAKALRGGFIELVGPETNSQLAAALEKIRARGESRTVFIDGAVNRLTQLAAAKDACFVYVMPVEKARLEAALDKIRLLISLSDTGTDAPPNAVRFDGALTQEKLKTLPEGDGPILLEDFTKVFLDLRQWRKLTGKRKVFFKNTLRLEFITVNLKDLTAEEFRTAARGIAPEKILFNPYGADV